MLMEGDLTLGGEHTTQYTDDVLYNCTLECFQILLTNVTPTNSVKNKIKIKKSAQSGMQACAYTCIIKLIMKKKQGKTNGI